MASSQCRPVLHVQQCRKCGILLQLGYRLVHSAGCWRFIMLSCSTFVFIYKIALIAIMIGVAFQHKHCMALVMLPLELIPCHQMLLLITVLLPWSAWCSGTVDCYSQWARTTCLQGDCPPIWLAKLSRQAEQRTFSFVRAVFFTYQSLEPSVYLLASPVIFIVLT